MSDQHDEHGLSIDETVTLLRRHAFEVPEDADTSAAGRTIIHSRSGGIGADWDLADAEAFAEKSHWRGWVDSLLGHNLGIAVHDGDRERLVCFAVERPKPEVDTRNDFLVGVLGDDLVFLKPPQRMSRSEAIRLAAWLVALADYGNDDKFDDVRAAVAST